VSIDKKARVGVLMGGLSSERKVSLKSGAAVLSALQERGWQAVGIDVGRDLPARLVEAKIDVAWLALHGRYGEDGCVQGLLEVMGLPYTGSGVRASAVAMDKIATKQAVRGLPAVRLANDAVLRAGDAFPEQVGLPAVVKPAVGGSTLGMGIVRERSQWEAAFATALAAHERVLVEAFVPGEEITVAVLDGVALPVVRIVPDSGFFDYEAKYTDGRTRYEVPAQLPAAVIERAQAAAIAAYEAIGCRGLARADFIVPSEGDPVFLEINTLPGMTATSLSPMAAGAVGVSFGELVERVLLAARTDG
jgi:D-alanine-D-alanine ligase